MARSLSSYIDHFKFVAICKRTLLDGKVEFLKLPANEAGALRHNFYGWRAAALLEFVTQNGPNEATGPQYQDIDDIHEWKRRISLKMRPCLDRSFTDIIFLDIGQQETSFTKQFDALINSPPPTREQLESIQATAPPILVEPEEPQELANAARIAIGCFFPCTNAPLIGMGGPYLNPDGTIILTIEDAYRTRAERGGQAHPNSCKLDWWYPGYGNLRPYIEDNKEKGESLLFFIKRYKLPLYGNTTALKLATESWIKQAKATHTEVWTHIPVYDWGLEETTTSEPQS